MKYYKRCFQPGTMSVIYFNKDGICVACLYGEKKVKVNLDDQREN